MACRAQITSSAVPVSVTAPKVGPPVDCRITEYPDMRDRLIGPVIADWRVLRVHSVRILITRHWEGVAAPAFIIKFLPSCVLARPGRR